MLKQEMVNVDARCQRKLGHFKVAERLLKTTLNRYSRAYGKRSVMLSGVLSELTEIKLGQGQPREALTYARRLAAIQQKRLAAAQWSVQNRAAQAMRQLQARLSLSGKDSEMLAELQKLQEQWRQSDKSLTDLIGLPEKSSELQKLRRNMERIEL